ncbi:lytic transglycosylase domain-containing protein [Roseomonas sp. E05]|uniref:lytic transglycosylase domain-containing protein n=1 Tax=Roseomonas sp. E05 TaxID=3046310 RepID=UPI0024BAB3E4|nr:lytic transglycosylase domain-containing protein [Roseomonas sp. E05]MDJ0388179.1 lytic transglycosylase domain-containing protein [Roseomonas sp. E05]
MPMLSASRPSLPRPFLGRALALALLPALALTAPAALAQPWAPEQARAAGRAALIAANAGRWSEAQVLADRGADPLADKIITWMRLQVRGQASAAEIADFLAANPGWPLQATLAQRGEEALPVLAEDALVLRLFAGTPPRGLPAVRQLAEALQRQGDAAAARRAVQAGWRDATPDAEAEAGFLAALGGVLGPEDHRARFERLAWTGQTAAAARMLPLLPPEARLNGELRLALAGGQAAAEAGAAPRAAADLGLAMELARYLRRQDRDREAAAVWQQAEPLQRSLTDEAARATWIERQILSRKLLRLGDAATAYRVAAAHGQTDGAALHDAEFLAGFIALRKLNDPARAAQHFARLGEDSSSVITRARAHYWRGRAAAAQGRAEEARAQFAAAAALPTAFYGQLGALALGETSPQLAARITALPAPQPTTEAASAFLGKEMAQAVLALADLGDTDRTRTFLLRLEDTAADPAEQVLTARLANSIGRPDNAVWVARRAGIDGVTMLAEGYPTPYPVPEAAPVEPAFVYAISRQESNFDPGAVSPANARGLMQLLPSTATLVARQLGIPHQASWLTGQPEHNLRLGAQYLGDQLARFGNLAMAAAAYNAGPRRVDDWIVSYGDPRMPQEAGGADMIDWIEQIPFSETRNYVQRVVENAVIYRALRGAGGRDHPLKPWLPVGTAR